MASSDEVPNGSVPNGTVPSGNKVPEWMLAREGIKLIINNKGAEAEEMFLQYPDSLVMFAGYSFAVMMDALMSYEEEKLYKAISTLKEVEKRCASENGWVKHVALKIFGSSETKNEASLADQLETQIILADSQVCIAILTFLQQDISGYFKGGWVLRKAWKVYQKVYKEVLDLYREHVGELYLPDASQPSSPSSHVTTTPEWEEMEVTTNGNRTIEKGTIVRLMGAVSFGYGLFQLGISLLPPSLMRLINILGFGTNRQHGLACLMYARQGTDMRAPLATLSLLWFHAIVRPFYAIDGTNVHAGVEASTSLLRESEEDFSQSAIFLFFKGRVCRLSSDTKGALTSYQQAVDNSTQREIRILCMHEIGWCYLIELEYKLAENTFFYLKSSSRWSRAFYTYLAAICAGASSDIQNYSLFDEMHAVIASLPKGSQLDEFLTKRSRCCPAGIEQVRRKSTVYWKLLVFEMLYLWNALPSCTEENIALIVEALDSPNKTIDEPMVGLSNLILGCAYCIQDRYDEGRDCFKKCLKAREKKPSNADDAHISAFCLYELGALLIKKCETVGEGKSYLQKAYEYTHYDFDQKLNVRIHTLLKNV